MKRNLTFLLLSLFCIVSVQGAEGMDSIVHIDNEYAGRHFIEDGKQWMVIWATSRIFLTKRYFIDGDTLVDNRLCKKLMLEEKDYEEKTSKKGLHMVVYEDNGKVFYYPSEASSSTNPVLLYDFNACPGDTLSLGGDNTNLVCYQIWNTLSLENGDECFRGQLATVYDENLSEVDEDSELPLYQWYEGIGSVFDPLMKIPQNNYMSGPIYWLYDCSVNGKVIYSRTMGFKLYPKGDVNHDGEVNVTDVMLAVNYILERGIQGFFIEESDINEDGSITIMDVMNIVSSVIREQ